MTIQNNNNHAAVILVDDKRATVSGALVFDTVPKLRKLGDSMITQKADLTFDFKEVTHSDSSALTLLTAWMRQSHRLKKSIAFVNLPKNLLDVAKVSGINKILPINGK